MGRGRNYKCPQAIPWEQLELRWLSELPWIKERKPGLWSLNLSVDCPWGRGCKLLWGQKGTQSIFLLSGRMSASILKHPDISQHPLQSTFCTLFHFVFSYRLSGLTLKTWTCIPLEFFLSNVISVVIFTSNMEEYEYH